MTRAMTGLDGAPVLLSISKDRATLAKYTVDPRNPELVMVGFSDLLHTLHRARGERQTKFAPRAIEWAASLGYTVAD